MKKISYGEFIATQTENIEDASFIGVSVFYNGIPVTQFGGEPCAMYTDEVGYTIEFADDSSVIIPANSGIEVFDEEETELNIDMEYGVKYNDLYIFLSLPF